LTGSEPAINLCVALLGSLRNDEDPRRRFSGLPSRPPGPQPPGLGPISEPILTPTPKQRTRFFGSVEIDTLGPVKASDAILNAVVMELQRTNGAKVKLTLEAEAPEGFSEADVGAVRDNACQLKFKLESSE
jgi:hypothetical protein